MSGTALTKKNYNCVDLAKFIASLLVVMIHSSFSEYNLPVLNNLTKLAVPFFFGCSGYFFYKGLKFTNGKIEKTKENRQKLWRYVSRIVVLYLSWSAVYLCVKIPDWYATGWLSVKAFIDFGLSFFLESSYYHLWYMVALIYATVIGYFLLSFINIKVFSVICILLYICELFISTYLWLEIDFVVKFNNLMIQYGLLWVQFMRTFMRAIPIMVLSYAIVKMNFKSTILLLSFSVVSFVLLCVETLLMNKFTSNKNIYDFLIFTIPCIAFMLKFLTNTDIKGNKEIFVLLRNLSTIIYCAHPLMIRLLEFIPGFSDINGIGKFVPAVLLSVVFSLLMIKAGNSKKLGFLKIFQ